MSTIRKKNKHMDKPAKKKSKSPKSNSGGKFTSEVCVIENLIPADQACCCEVEYCCLV